MNEPSPNDRIDRKARLFGLLAISMALFLGVTCVYMPIRDARNGVENISLPTKATVIIPLALVVGLLGALFGKKWNRWVVKRNGEKERLNIIGWIGVTACAAAGIGLYHWVDTFIGSFGYE